MGAEPAGDRAVPGLLRKGGYEFLVFTGMIAFDIAFGVSLARAEGRRDVKEGTEYGLERSSSVNLKVGSPSLLPLRALGQSTGGFQSQHLGVSWWDARSQRRDSPAWSDLCGLH